MHIYDTVQGKVVYSNPNFEPHKSLNMPDTHYYFTDSLELLNAASGRLGAAPLSDQKIDKKNWVNQVANGVVLTLKTLSARYPRFQEKVSSIGKVEDLKIVDFYAEHGVCVAYSDKKKCFWAFNINDDGKPSMFDGTYDDFHGRATT